MSNYGRVRSLDRIVTQQGLGKPFHGCRKGKILKQREQNQGYMLVWLSKQGKTRKAYTVHRLVAETFISNPLCLGFVNHKDGNKKNNNAVNLEWCTKSQNSKHAYSTLHIQPQRKTAVRCVETGQCFESIKDAAAAIKLSGCAISNVLHNRSRRAGGFSWERIKL